MQKFIYSRIPRMSMICIARGSSMRLVVIRGARLDLWRLDFYPRSATIHHVLHHWARPLRRKRHLHQRFGGMHETLVDFFFLFNEVNQAIRSCSRIYLEAYTSILMVEKSRLVCTVLRMHLQNLTVRKIGGILRETTDTGRPRYG